MIIYVFLALILILIVWIVSTYNFFASSRMRIKASVQEIGNQLKRQVDLIPNLESSAKAYLKHERAIYDKLTEARKSISQAIKSGNVQKMAEASSQLASLLPQIQVIVESNPELKSSEVVAKLMEELRDTADKVMYARRLVIDLTADYNVKRVAFPSNLVAKMFNFPELPGLIIPEEGEHIRVDSGELKTPKITLE